MSMSSAEESRPMYARSKWHGHVLIEVMVVVIVLGLIGPQLWNVMNVTIHRTNTIIQDRIAMVERLDMHVRIQEDAINSYRFSDHCCFSTAAHLICYDIKNERLRRRKRRWDAQRFYAHYIGQRPVLDAMACSMENKMARVTIKKVIGEPLAWAFVLGEK